MLREFLDRLLEVRKTEIFEVEGKPFTNGNLKHIEPPQERVIEPDSLEIDTLRGIKDYLDTNIDDLKFDEMIALIHSHKLISIETKLHGYYKQRLRYLVSRSHENKFDFGHFYDVEDFVIALQTNFKKNDDQAKILRVVGNLKEDNSQGVKDDGVTQKVVTKKGVTLGNDEDLPNPVVLAPYRTFHEIDQPESLFVLRLKDGPKCALFEADGGKWRMEAMLNIKKWLQTNIPKDITIIA